MTYPTQLLCLGFLPLVLSLQSSIALPLSLNMSQFTQALPAEIVSAFSSVALKELEEKFCEFDTSGDGTISFEEFRKVLYNIGEDDDEEKAREMMRAIDIDQNGTLNFVEFVRFVHSIRTKSNTDSNKNRYILKRTVTSFAPAVQGDGGASHVIPDSERVQGPPPSCFNFDFRLPFLTISTSL